MSANILLIGLDGATDDILRPMIERGYLPNIARVRESGAWGELMSTYPPASPTAWSSLMTGTNPGQHGVFSFTVKRPGTYYVDVTTSSTIGVPSLWDLLGEQGRQVAVINMPMHYPPWSINGVMISGMGTPGRDVTFTHPPELKDEIESKVGDYLLDVSWARYAEGEEHRFLDDLLTNEGRRYEAARYLFKRQDWDLFAIVFTGLDRLQHRVWRPLEEIADGSVDPTADPASVHGKVLAYFKLMDDGVGELMSLCGEQTTTVLMSDHGFGPCERLVEVNNLLAELGYLRYNEATRSEGRRRPPLYKRLLRSLGLNRKRFVSLSKKLSIDPYKYLEQGSKAINRIDWSRTRAFCYSLDGIYINLQGRERHGIVDPAEYDRLREEIVSRLREYTDAETGRRPFRDVGLKEAVYRGPRLDEAPDLILTDYDRAYEPYFQLFKKEGLVPDVFAPPGVKQGTHRDNGIVCLHGRGVRAGATMPRADIVDVAPTILHLMGLQAPSYFDGRVLVDGLSDAEKGKETVGVLVDQGADLGRRDEVSREEADKIAERLKGLGYLE